MQTVINLKDTKRQAFLRGFWKGLAAPLMLYSVSEMPPEALVSAQSLPQRQLPKESDWVRVGNALRQAAETDRASRG